MSSKDIQERFNELLQNNKIICSESEIDDYINMGLIFNIGEKYKTRSGQLLSIQKIPDLHHNLNINLSFLINACQEELKNAKTNKIYCMSERCYNNYKDKGLIIEYNHKSYYRFFDKELWLVYMI